MSEAGPQFGKVPTPMVTAGGLQRMRGGDAVVYLAIAAHAKPNMHATIGQRRIAELTGLYIGRVNESIKRLASAGLLEIESKGSGRRATTFRLCVPAGPNASDGDSVPAERSASNAQRSGFEAVAFRDESRSVPAAPEQIRGSESQRERATTEAQPTLPGVRAQTPKPKPDPVAFTFPTREGKPWQLRRAKLDELREAFPFVHVDTELEGIAGWLDRNPDKRPRPAGVWNWLRKLLARKQAERPLPGPAHYGDGFAFTESPTDPTGPEVDALLRED